MDNSRPIQVGFVVNDDPLPSDFHYTCCCWIHNSNFFSKEPFSFEKVFVAGTMEGPLVCFGINNTKIESVSILIGHHSNVSDIINGLQGKQFLSISNDGTLCEWRTTDTSCICKYPEIVPSGNLFLSIQPTEINHVWICSIGQRADLFDTKTQSILCSISIPSLVSFSYMTSANSVYVSESCIVVVTNNNIRQIKFENNEVISNKKIQNISSNIFENYYSTPYGVVRIKRNMFSVLYERGNSKDYELQLDESDSIQYVYWVTKKHLCLVTFGGCFFVVNISHSKELDRIKIENIEKYKFENTFVSGKFDFQPEFGFVFPHSSKSVRYLNKESQFSFTPVKFVAKYSIPIGSSDNIITLNKNNHEIEVFNWSSLEKVEVSHKSQSKITCIYSIPVKYRQQKLMIYAGGADGTVSFYFDISETPIRTIDALASSIESFIRLPIKIGGRESVLAVGEDGSIALIKWTDIIVRYPGFNTKVLEVYFYEQQSFLIVKYSSGEYFVYSLKSSDIIDCLSVAPPLAQKFYPSEECFEETTFSLETIDVGRSSQVIARLRLDSELDDSNSKILQAKYIIFRLLLPGVPVKNTPPGISDKCGSNLVFYGDSPGTITLFYKNQALTGHHIFESSEDIAGMHFIAWTILSTSFSFTKPRYSPDYNGSYFLPLLSQLINHKSQHIRDTASLACANSMMATPISTAQNIVTPFISNRHPMTETEKFLLSMVFVAQPDTLPSSFLLNLFDFLVSKMKSNSEEGYLSTVILLNGFDLWEKTTNTNDLLLKIMREMVSHQRHQHVNTIFAIVSGIHFQEFFQSFDKIVDENVTVANGNIVLKRLFELTNRVSFSGVDMIGAPATLRIAYVGSKYPKLAQVVAEELARATLTNRCVSVCQNVCIVAVNGTCYVFRNCSFEFSVQLTETPISALILDKNAAKCAAISNESSEVIIFLTRTKKESLLGAKKPVIEKRYEVLKSNDVKAEWGPDGNLVIKYD
ncbi:hypothetical protein TVAG_114190 [Trichomonas vaginalis G3]|uniref:Uncharacterized protein n=1 Tax=Trichomonas vaginalis (strain ATCC PRA-98 / G3) TaxID=412133 RepID=A2F3U6_TRIV3|nr:WD40 repeat-like family [Trichomonas vaginalis G3]EAY00415.1 hypothetical protein TVAG_114190 [Trichomonas vaginalis G3]KAI5526549.1 WD40 repeat-like family [Trichomonas vaginalis G3]|eukprot:XP_001313344.1 hypothetical protein [Trichomonas vaginalis G3]